jgi:hypothetical protein
MRYKTLHYLSLAYSISMGGLIAYFLISEILEGGWKIATVIWSIGMFGMLSQLVYTIMSRRVLISEPYEEIDTLDNEMMYSEEEDPRIIQNSGIAVFLALMGGIVSTAILILSSLVFKEIFELEFTTLERFLTMALTVVGLTLSAPVVIYNFRTYKLSGVREMQN